MRLPSHSAIAAAVLLSLAACSTTPTQNTSLTQARQGYDAARADARVSSLATTELQRAGDTLQQAEQAWSDRKPEATVNHLAYMAIQRTQIAQDTAAGRTAQAVVDNASTERNAALLTQRNRQLQSAQQTAANAQDRSARDALTAEAATEQARQANARALQDQQRLATGQARLDAMQSELEALQARRTARGMVLTLPDVLFDNATSTLRVGGVRTIVKLADFLKADAGRTVSIEGHTDSNGSAEFNMALSQRRADAVQSALRSMGVGPDQLKTVALGEDVPVSSNANAAGRQMNRRVEVVFSDALRPVSSN